MNELLNSPNALGPHGEHLSAWLRICAMQLGRQAGWAAEAMEQAARRIDELEDKLIAQAATKKEFVTNESGRPPEETRPARR